MLKVKEEMMKDEVQVEERVVVKYNRDQVMMHFIGMVILTIGMFIALREVL